MPRRRKPLALVNVYRKKPSKAEKALTIATKNRKRLSKVEYKHHDTIIEDNFDRIGAEYSLHVIPVGDGPGAREGIKVNPTSLSWRFFMIGKGSGAQRNELVRVLIVRGKHENDVPFDIDTVTAQLGNANAPIFQFRPDKRMNYSVLLDRTYVLGPDEAVGVNNANDNNMKYSVGSHKLSGTIHFDGGDATGADVQSGGIYLLLVGQHDDATTGGSEFRGRFRLRYTDL